MLWIVAILGLGLLMVVHEAGHLLAARAFGMRVIKFSVGFGPALWRYQPSGSQTVYQVALIPFLAYVQIAGMNPLEDVDPTDKGSYANAALHARISAIFAGPFANYLFASVLVFAALMIGGMPVATTEVAVGKDTPAARAGMESGDRIVAIDGKHLDRHDWEKLRRVVLASPGRELAVRVQRDNRRILLKVTPEAKDEGGLIGVTTVWEKVPVALKEALVQSVEYPAVVVHQFVVVMAKIVTGQQKPQLLGPPGIVNETKKAAERGWDYYLQFLGVLSAYLAGFNLVPFPALDGGRLMFLGYEAVTRRRPNARIEAHIHALGLLMLLALIAVVSVFDITGK